MKAYRVIEYRDIELDGLTEIFATQFDTKNSAIAFAGTVFRYRLTDGESITVRIEEVEQ